MAAIVGFVGRIETLSPFPYLLAPLPLVVHILRLLLF